MLSVGWKSIPFWQLDHILNLAQLKRLAIKRRPIATPRASTSEPRKTSSMLIKVLKGRGGKAMDGGGDQTHVVAHQSKRRGQPRGTQTGEAEEYELDTFSCFKAKGTSSVNLGSIDCHFGQSFFVHLAVISKTFPNFGPLRRLSDAARGQNGPKRGRINIASEAEESTFEPFSLTFIPSSSPPTIPTDQLVIETHQSKQNRNEMRTAALLVLVIAFLSICTGGIRQSNWTNIAKQTKQQLLTPCQFSYADGVIERVQCPQEAEEWSNNVKKAVLNIIQLNLKQNNAQGLHQSGASRVEQFQQEATGQGKSFKIPEITMEGACQTMYTINKAQRFGQQQQQFNVTKTINFKKCQKVADVANGFQADQPQAQCSQCQQYWAQQQSDQQNSPIDQQKTNARQMEESDQRPCANCDPKEVKENELDRSDVAASLATRPTNTRCAAAKVGTDGAVMQTVVVANLEAVAVKPKKQQIPAIIGASEHDTLMFTNDKAVDEKRFFAVSGSEI
ncbi:hypothetical protein niasHT_012651 [Heterodera trifolii]|uniref:Vitellogenin domain-containing protein n=1 Tax=Heterodera trifolii TaxID=157864 RepID=A0ABD2L3P7_9BILA